MTRLKAERIALKVTEESHGKEAAMKRWTPWPHIGRGSGELVLGRLAIDIYTSLQRGFRGFRGRSGGAARRRPTASRATCASFVRSRGPADCNRFREAVEVNPTFKHAVPHPTVTGAWTLSDALATRGAHIPLFASKAGAEAAAAADKRARYTERELREAGTVPDTGEELL